MSDLDEAKKDPKKDPKKDDKDTKFSPFNFGDNKPKDKTKKKK